MNGTNKRKVKPTKTSIVLKVVIILALLPLWWFLGKVLLWSFINQWTTIALIFLVILLADSFKDRK